MSRLGLGSGERSAPDGLGVTALVIRWPRPRPRLRFPCGQGNSQLSALTLEQTASNSGPFWLIRTALAGIAEQRPLEEQVRSVAERAAAVICPRHMTKALAGTEPGSAERSGSSRLPSVLRQEQAGTAPLPRQRPDPSGAAPLRRVRSASNQAPGCCRSRTATKKPSPAQDPSSSWAGHHCCCCTRLSSGRCCWNQATVSVFSLGWTVQVA